MFPQKGALILWGFERQTLFLQQQTTTTKHSCNNRPPPQTFPATSDDHHNISATIAHHYRPLSNISATTDHHPRPFSHSCNNTLPPQTKQQTTTTDLPLAPLTSDPHQRPSSHFWNNRPSRQTLLSFLQQKTYYCMCSIGMTSTWACLQQLTIESEVIRWVWSSNKSWRTKMSIRATELFTSRLYLRQLL